MINLSDYAMAVHLFLCFKNKGSIKFKHFYWMVVVLITQLPLFDLHHITTALNLFI